MAHVNTKDELKRRAGAVFKELKKNGDEKRAEQLASVIQKWARKEVYIALCGHYSAGKSSLVNALLQEHVLPTSPIPTSANLVLVRRGETKTALHTTDGKYALIKGAYDKEKVQAYCKDGSQIEMVEIEGDFPGIAPHAVLIDTPGIDSTDDAHFLSASSILHQADALFYVVHYNHVHSEENVNFLRSIREKIPNIYFIVNQIDRHDESETGFQTYKKQVLDMLQREGIKADHLFFTSVTETDHPLNEFNRLRKKLTELQQQTEQQLRGYTEQKVIALISEHTEMLMSDEDSSLSDETSALSEKVRTLKAELSESPVMVKQAEEQIKKEIQTIIQNANLTPFDMRELAKFYLESNEKNFKKGFLFSKAKTAEEKQRRKDAFLRDINKRIQAEIDWHIIEAFKTFANRFGVKSDDFLSDVLQFATKVGEPHLLKSLKNGAALSSEYVLNYTKELAESIRREAKACAQNLIEQFTHLLRRKEEQRLTVVKNEYEEGKTKLAELNYRLAAQQNSYEKANRLWDHWENGGGDVPEEDWYEPKKKEWQNPLETKQPDDSIRHQDDNTPESGGIGKRSVSEYMDRFLRLARDLEDVPVLQKQRKAFLAKTERLHSRRFTIALFGAFSSGKSSFANALCGQKVLPSSPTPTTATINKITEPTDEKQNGTADVAFKTEEEITAELNQLLDGKMSGAKGATFSEKLEHLLRKGKLHQDERPAVEHVLSAYQRFQHYIVNQDVCTISSGELHPYVADEETACAVREVTVYLHTPVTNKGITIVDTPGASSINKRHTELAFQYMKNADALLYLTYYQHAFSRADRSFLRKLGLIKDAFGMDKMFFILNAADLAGSAEELESVEHYVRGELSKEGIKHPHIYHVSSKQELSGTTAPFNEFSRFRKDLSEFIENGLAKAAVDQLIHEGKTLCETVFQLRRSLHRSAKETEAEKERIAKAYEAASSAIAETKAGTYIVQMTEKDIEEQFYYIRQRLSFYAYDLFKAAIHPGLQNGNWQENLQQALKSVLKEYEFEFLQELKALDIRIENMMVKYADEQWGAALQQKLEGNPYFSVHLKAEPPKAGGAVADGVSAEEAVFREELKTFKSPKAFFQQNGKARLVESLTSKLSSITDEWIQHEKQTFLSRSRKNADVLQEKSFQNAMDQLAEQKEVYFHEPVNKTDGETIEKAYAAAKEWLRDIES
ncbi:dynamin family protein [Bacillus sonorensis]|nr:MULTISPECIES: dynamin family protein [Bacillus]ASB88771.1 uncharacterized protein S101395_02263 [Bacillus sonorensis]MCZ0072085.1 dynamin family protein [Bacillus sonorensis]MCZ0090705.1 dynamin family protein [Bacillus sonorensis]MDR4958647.1 dynamin family protein [Bacillus sonorensis]MEC0338880.1 dynamin family protein [Bacillus sonorensis]